MTHYDIHQNIRDISKGIWKSAWVIVITVSGAVIKSTGMILL
jgi:hypothetical protein